MDPEETDSIHLFNKDEFEGSPVEIQDIVQFRKFAEQLSTHTYPSVLEIQQITNILVKIKSGIPPPMMQIQQNETFIENDDGNVSGSSVAIPANNAASDEEHASYRMEILNQRDERRKVIRKSINSRMVQKSAQKPNRSDTKYNLRKIRREPPRFQTHRRSRELLEQAKLKARQKWLESGKTRRFSSLRQSNGIGKASKNIVK